MKLIVIIQYIDLLLHHIIPIWLFFGFLAMLIFCILLKVEKENIATIFKNEVNITTIINTLILGPVGIYLILIDYAKQCKEEREKMREECGWWELKEFGGKY